MRFSDSMNIYGLLLKLRHYERQTAQKSASRTGRLVDVYFIEDS